MIILLVIILNVLYCNYVIKKRVITIYSNKIDRNMDIIFVSDLHLGKYTKKKELNKIIDKINSLDGQYLLIGGDMIGKNILNYYSDEEISGFINKLEIKNKYFVEGNHDDYSFSFYKCFNCLNDKIIDLSNNIKLVGLGWDECECLDYKLNRNDFNILLSHYPDRVVDYSKVDLALGGHSHGKQINIPFLRVKYHKEKYFKGLYKVRRNTKLYVSSGLGFSFFKIRFNCCREIVKIEVRKC